MSEKERGITIVVGSGWELAASRLALLKEWYPNALIVTAEEYKENALSQTSEFKSRTQIIEPISIQTVSYHSGHTNFSSRAARRKAERDAKKSKNKK